MCSYSIFTIVTLSFFYKFIFPIIIVTWSYENLHNQFFKWSTGHSNTCHKPINNVLLNKDLEKDGLVQGYYVEGSTKNVASIKYSFS